MSRVLGIHNTSASSSWEHVKIKQEWTDKVLQGRSLQAQSRLLSSLKMLPAQTTTQSPVASDEQQTKPQRNNTW